MSKYEIDELIKLWELEKIQPEQVIGQLLLHVKSLEQQSRHLTREMTVVSPTFQPVTEFKGKKDA